MDGRISAAFLKEGNNRDRLAEPYRPSLNDSANEERSISGSLLIEDFTSIQGKQPIHSLIESMQKIPAFSRRAWRHYFPKQQATGIQRYTVPYCHNKCAKGVQWYFKSRVFRERHHLLLFWLSFQGILPRLHVSFSSIGRRNLLKPLRL
jgi:hypothetical protein